MCGSPALQGERIRWFCVFARVCNMFRLRYACKPKITRDMLMRTVLWVAARMCVMPGVYTCVFTNQKLNANTLARAARQRLRRPSVKLVLVWPCVSLSARFIFSLSRGVYMLCVARRACVWPDCSAALLCGAVNAKSVLCGSSSSPSNHQSASAVVVSGQLEASQTRARAPSAKSSIAPYDAFVLLV